MGYNGCNGTQDDIDRVRVLIPDTDNTRLVFSDNEILAFYAIQASTFQTGMRYQYPAGASLPSTPVSYFRVAAIALDVLASNNAKLAAIQQVLDIKLGFASAHDALAARAAAYREIDDNSAAFAIAEQTSTQWAFIDRFWRQWQRQLS